MRALLLSGLLLAFCPGARAEGRTHTILDAAIEVARRDHPDLSDAAVRAEIARLARLYRELLGTATEPAARADAFRRLMFEAEKFESVKSLDSAEHLHLDSVLRSKKGYCLSLSVVALAVAEMVGAPLFGVAMPNHFFVRYDDGKFRRNLELTRKGAALDDHKLREQVGKLEKDTVYLRNLKPDEVTAYLLHNRGYVALLRKRHALAKADFEAAIKIQPGIGEAHRNLGVVLGEQKSWKEAKRAFIRAINLNARDVNALVNLAICRHALGERDSALQDLEVALALDSEHARATELRDRWRAEKEAPTTKAGAAALPAAPKGLKPGLRARYYAGMKFERLRTERVDRELDFDWQNAAPGPKVPRDRFSARWDGYFKAPRDGVYTFFLVANDGVRLFLGGKKLMENWKNMGLSNWYGTQDVHLAAGWHPIKIEHFDGMGGARMMLRIGLEGREQPLEPKEHLFHVPPKKEAAKGD
ncbi:MAG: PA14 domain-containing protein [Planctomycetota bacterium]